MNFKIRIKLKKILEQSDFDKRYKKNKDTNFVDKISNIKLYSFIKENELDYTSLIELRNIILETHSNIDSLFNTIGLIDVKVENSNNTINDEETFIKYKQDFIKTLFNDYKTILNQILIIDDNKKSMFDLKRKISYLNNVLITNFDEDFRNLFETLCKDENINKEQLEKIGIYLDLKIDDFDTYLSKKDDSFKILENLDNETFESLSKLLTSNNIIELNDNDKNNKTFMLFNEILNMKINEINCLLLNVLTQDFNNIKEVLIKAKNDFNYLENMKILYKDILLVNANDGLNFIMGSLIEYINKNTLEINIETYIDENDIERIKIKFEEPFSVDLETGKISYKLSNKGIQNIIYHIDGTNKTSIMTIFENENIEKEYNNILMNPLKMNILQNLIEEESNTNDILFTAIFNDLKNEINIELNIELYKNLKNKMNNTFDCNL